MNKKAIITAMLALVAFFLASCSSDDDNEGYALPSLLH